MKLESMVSDRSRFRKELVFFGILLVFITYMMFYVFYIKDGVMYAGLTVCGDYAPHTAMMRSFSWEIISRPSIRISEERM